MRPLNDNTDKQLTKRPLLFWRVVKPFLARLFKTLVVTIKFFTAKRVMAKASALTYSTLLAIVPILAVVFAIGRGFGFNKFIEIWFRNLLASQPQAAEMIIGWVNSYLIHAKSGVFLGIGLVFMLYTVLMLVNNVEETFNEIWQVRDSRSLYRSFTNYLAAFFLFPIFIVVTTGFSVVMTALASSMSDDVLMLGTVLRYVLEFLPYVVQSGLFVGLFVSMPNTYVDWRCAVVPGIIAGVGMQWLQLFYVHSQMWVTGYNAIYGSFAALPLFMLWVQISWTICLFCAEMTFTNQQLKRFGVNLGETGFHPYVEMGDDERDEASIAMYADGLDGL